MDKQRIEQLTAVPLFADLSKRELNAVDQLMAAITFDADTVLMSQGSVGREFMIIRSGSADVHVDGAGVVAAIGAGDFIGELSVLTGSTRNATVTTTSELEAEVLNRRELAALFDEQPELTRKVLLTAIERLQAGEQTTAS